MLNLINKRFPLSLFKLSFSFRRKRKTLVKSFDEFIEKSKTSNLNQIIILASGFNRNMKF